MADVRRSWGTVRRMRNGAYQASYIGPDAIRYYGPHTYRAKADAEGWLSRERRLVELDDWRPPADRVADELAAQVVVREYAEQWLRERDLSPKTRWLYRTLLDDRILPVFGDLRMREVTPALVRSWWATMDKATPTKNSQAYRVLRTIFNTAVSDKILTENPVKVEGAGKVSQRRNLEVFTADELRRVVADMPEEYRAATLVLAWCGLRFGELIELRRKDVVREGDGRAVVLRVRRAATLVAGKLVVGTPKSEAGIRDVAIPPHVSEVLTEHMRVRVGRGADAFMFTTRQNGNRLTLRAFTGAFKKSAKKVGKPNMRVHDLRHTGATLAAQAGATTKELMARLGHSTPAMSMRYQHASADRDAAIAARLSELAAGDSQ